VEDARHCAHQIPSAFKFSVRVSLDRVVHFGRCVDNGNRMGVINSTSSRTFYVSKLFDNIFVLFFQVLCILVFIREAVSFIDSTKSDSVLFIGACHLMDRRLLHRPLAWEAVESVKIDILSARGREIAAFARFKLRESVQTKTDWIFAYYLTRFRSNGQGKELNVLISDLDVKSETVGRIIEDLVKRHGGDVRLRWQ
jgi:hypothetical protein